MIIANTQNTITLSTPLIEEGEQFNGSISLLIEDINYVKKHIFNNAITVIISYIDEEFVIFNKSASKEANTEADNLVNDICQIINKFFSHEAF